VLEMFLKSLRSSNWRERHSAGTVLLDRALGRPVQQLTGEDGGPITIMHLVAMREIGEAIIASLASPQAVINGGAAAEIPAELSDLGAPATE
jgi:hypothetical protein